MIKELRKTVVRIMSMEDAVNMQNIMEEEEFHDYRCNLPVTAFKKYGDKGCVRFTEANTDNIGWGDLDYYNTDFLDHTIVTSSEICGDFDD